MDFIAARVDKMMGAGVPKDIRQAVLAGSNFLVPQMLAAAEALQVASQADNYKPAVESLARVFNLAEKAPADMTVNSDLFENDQEKALAQAVANLSLGDDIKENLDQLFGLSPVIDAFFDNTMVMSDDEALKNNRLALLSALAQKAKTVAAFNKLNTK